ncbi:hypothetical protein [Virgibacillus halodenitrificans]|uniref:hypothetical protein n=1 Tax=Virgibacillus halodenitrificans TaxID=1482 RepID=UPI000EF526AC|nr:hypothetical protein [Virgibacillus halodenitrificans]
MDYSVRTRKAILAATGSHITAAKFSTVKDQVVKEVAVSDYKSEWQGIYLTLANGRILRKYADTAGEVQYQFVEKIPKSREKGFWAKAGELLNLKSTDKIVAKKDINRVDEVKRGENKGNTLNKVTYGDQYTKINGMERKY